MTHDIPSAIATSTNVQNAISLLMAAIRHEAKQQKVSANETLNAIDSPLLDDPLDLVIEALIEQRFAEVLKASGVSK